MNRQSQKKTPNQGATVNYKIVDRPTCSCFPVMTYVPFDELALIFAEMVRVDLDKCRFPPVIELCDDGVGTWISEDLLHVLDSATYSRSTASVESVARDAPAALVSPAE